jgi:hypothetical protein
VALLLGDEEGRGAALNLLLELDGAVVVDVVVVVEALEGDEVADAQALGGGRPLAPDARDVVDGPRLQEGLEEGNLLRELGQVAAREPEREGGRERERGREG